MNSAVIIDLTENLVTGEGKSEQQKSWEEGRTREQARRSNPPSVEDKEEDEVVLIVDVDEHENKREMCSSRCDGCGRNTERLFLLSGCGHEICETCVFKSGERWRASATTAATNMPPSNTSTAMPSAIPAIQVLIGGRQCIVKGCSKVIPREVVYRAFESLSDTQAEKGQEEEGDRVAYEAITNWFDTGAHSNVSTQHNKTNFTCPECYNYEENLVHFPFSKVPTVKMLQGIARQHKLVDSKSRIPQKRVLEENVSAFSRKLTSHNLAHKSDNSILLCSSCSYVSCRTCGMRLKAGATVPHSCCDQAIFSKQLCDVLKSISEAQTSSFVGKQKGRVKHDTKRQRVGHYTYPSSSSKASNGIGYGGNQDEMLSFGVKKAREQAAQEEKNADKILGNSFQTLLKMLRRAQAAAGESLSTWHVFCLLTDSEVLKKAVLNLLQNDSFLDISNRAFLYRSLMSLLREFSKQSGCLRFLNEIGQGEDGSKSAAICALGSLSQQCSVALKTKNKIDGTQELDLNSDCDQLPFYICQVAQEVIGRVDRICKKQTVTDVVTGMDSNQVWMSTFSKRKFREIDLVNTNFYFRSDREFCSLGQSTNPNRNRSNRIMKEIATLSGSRSLPCAFDSSIFLCVDKSRYDALRACIVPPRPTPYANGMFIFDIFLPRDYPNVPPRVQFLTTGGGSVRFNPNLYVDGKVCLSLLGTWHGPKWNATTSTILQVLISIQHFIFVTEPYFNEPGFESAKGSSVGNHASADYNRRIRQYTLNIAILQAIMKPELGFGEIARRLFKLKHNDIIQQCDEWAREDPTLVTLCERVKSALRKI